MYKMKEIKKSEKTKSLNTHKKEREIVKQNYYTLQRCFPVPLFYPAVRHREGSGFQRD